VARRPKQSGGGELIDQGVHLIDLAGWFLGDFAKSKVSLDAVLGHEGRRQRVSFAAHRRGQTAWLHASCTEWKNLFSLELYGRDANSRSKDSAALRPEKLTFYKMLPQMGPPETTSSSFPCRRFVGGRDARVSRRHPREARTVPGLREAIRTLEIVETIYRASGFPVSEAVCEARCHVHVDNDKSLHEALFDRCNNAFAYGCDYSAPHTLLCFNTRFGRKFNFLT